ncbi:hypothetical protein LC653_41110 [Nostoc sp. CHAB 5784]|uniref:hypothetical protein n=1 Tax=Nostoc mirabile TaxID=2907820 RepID=UPI001E6269A7|nr:hypothetical protein [Nostoc mirabile]MCC5670030.1 hypothetical protein [Nostoc mirabile CHAB5784]
MDSRIQSYLRLAAIQQRETEQIGSFLATFNRWNVNPFLNYAIPDNNATPTPNEVNALIHAYQRRGRKPRLEYVTKLAPAVEEILISAGFVVEGRLIEAVIYGRFNRLWAPNRNNFYQSSVFLFRI